MAPTLNPSVNGGVPFLVVQSALNLTTLTTASFTPATNDIIVVKAISADAGTPPGTPTGGGWTYAAQVADATASHTNVHIWTAKVTTGGTAQTVAVTWSGTTNWHSMVVEVWSNGQVAATPATADTRGSGAPATTIVTAANGSIVSWCNGDWAAISPTGRTYNTTSATPTEELVHDGSTTNYVAYYAYQSAASAGSQTFGLTAPTGQTWTLAAVEIQDAGGAAPVDSPLPFAPPPGYMTPMALASRVTLGDLTVASGATPVSLADTTAGADALTVSASAPLADTGSGADALTVTVAVTLADTGAGADSLASSQPVGLADTGSGGEALTATTALPLTDSGVGADTLAAAAAVPLVDAGAGVDALSASGSGNPSLPDTGAGAEALTAAVTLPLADTAVGADLLTVTVALPLTDPRTGVDSLAVVRQVTLADTATAADLLGSATVAALADLAAAADSLSIAGAGVPVPPFTVTATDSPTVQTTATDTPATTVTATTAPTATLTATDRPAITVTTG